MLLSRWDKYLVMCSCRDKIGHCARTYIIIYIYIYFYFLFFFFTGKCFITHDVNAVCDVTKKDYSYF